MQRDLHDAELLEQGLDIDVMEEPDVLSDGLVDDEYEESFIDDSGMGVGDDSQEVFDEPRGVDQLDAVEELFSAGEHEDGHSEIADKRLAQYAEEPLDEGDFYAEDDNVHPFEDMHPQQYDNDIPGEPSGPATTPPGSPNKSSTAVVPATPSHSGPATFAAVLGESGPPSARGHVDMVDVEWVIINSNIQRDETLHPSLQDDLLKPYYVNLEKYRSGAFITWSPNVPRQGMTSFRTWGSVCPNVIFSSCMNSINFRKHGNYVNLARVALNELCVRNVGAKNQYYNLYTSDKQVAVCLSAVRINESFIHNPPTRGLRKKGVSGTLHTQEYERTAGCVCTCFGHPKLHAQIYLNRISFETRTEFKQEKGDPSSLKTEPADASPAVLSPSVAVSAAAKSATATKAADQFALPFNAEIPVYDARKVEVDFDKHLDDLSSFPRWKGEVPVGSFAVIAYTTGTFYSTTQEGWAVSFNIQWVMLIGVPPEYDI
ncbi:hypothetical protein EST38_g14655 [Candolleomyces aberdarensis]|uniref:Uncharacterized protein n=1 Tax=Candolleomyces aberdarensis TaxID=2316362 RepID=A0A4Q2CWQ2_9AGAR|nr:hypothetical protein EST38_g14655 [Candolleomyces aberdarensis]